MLKKLEGGKEKVDSDRSVAAGSTIVAWIGAISTEGGLCDADRQLQQAQFSWQTFLKAKPPFAPWFLIVASFSKRRDKIRKLKIEEVKITIEV
jgi:hypothetical protein